MADDPSTPVEEPKVDAPKVEAKEEPKREAPKLDPTKPLSQQTKILDQLEPTKEEPKDDAEGEATVKPAADEKQPDESGNAGATDEPADSGDAGDSDTTPTPEPEYEAPVDLPPIAQYILDNLPEIQTMGHTADGKDKLFKIKRLEDLPQDFEPATRRDELVLNAAISSQEINARELYSRYQQQEQDNQVKEFLNQQATEVQADISALQKEGILEKFKYETDDPKFDSDPAVKEANAIYDLFEKTNKAYADAKKTYRISYRDAADKFYAARSRTKPAEKAEATPEQKERQKVAAQVGAPGGADPNATKPRMPAGSTLRDVMRLYNQGRI